MRQISDGHEIRPRGGLLLVTTLHFYLHRYFPVAIDRSIREQSFLENLHMGNQPGVSEAKNPATRKKRSRHHIPGWWSSKRANLLLLFTDMLGTDATSIGAHAPNATPEDKLADEIIVYSIGSYVCTYCR